MFGFNPALPSLCSSEPPALEGRVISRVISDNLNAMWRAREEFIRLESSEKIRRALSHQIRPTYVENLSNGDSVFYKRADSPCWRGPGVVIGRDGKQVLVRHGGIYVRVHTCRLQKASTNGKLEDESGVENNTELKAPQSQSLTDCVIVSDEYDKPNTLNEDLVGGQGGQVVVARENDSVPTLDGQSAELLQETVRGESHPTGSLVGKRIDCYRNGSGQRISGKVISRAGKATGKYSNCYNICKDSDGEVEWIDLSRDVSDWYVIEDDKEIFILKKCDLVQEAKQLEVDSWVKNGVFEEVEDCGQEFISVRWVITEKIKDGKEVVKARLVARGYEEALRDCRTDSPTCSKESLRVALCIMSSMSWLCHTIDIKAAFLQGCGIDREVYIFPPPEFYQGCFGN